ncbi:unnamed protein product [Albugo candida]|uniref:Uncharacterized protein n=1 Tax=Albugo candida TaxID=65357 RepID=A0A024FVL2_9STRA|nr:unnamed protein product [Albugo candida]|eukprot:CCI11165.1 unnamed protein product [Albugo candida]
MKSSRHSIQRNGDDRRIEALNGGKSQNDYVAVARSVVEPTSVSSEEDSLFESSSAASLARDQNIGSKASSGWSFVQNTLDDLNLSENVKTGASTVFGMQINAQRIVRSVEILLQGLSQIARSHRDILLLWKKEAPYHIASLLLPRQIPRLHMECLSVKRIQVNALPRRSKSQIALNLNILPNEKRSTALI